MTDARLSPTDEMLGAYADGELGAADAERIDRLLALDPDSRLRLAAIERVNNLVRLASGHAASPTRPMPRPFALRQWSDWRLAASFVLAACLLVGILAVERDATGPATDWSHSALSFHDSYVRSRSTTAPESLLNAAQVSEEELTARASFSPATPDLSPLGYAPTGAHLIDGPNGPVLYVPFEAARGPPIGFTMTRSQAAGGAGDTPAMRARQNELRLVSWSSGDFDYGLSAELPESELMSVVETARRSLPPLVE